MTDRRLGWAAVSMAPAREVAALCAERLGWDYADLARTRGKPHRRTRALVMGRRAVCQAMDRAGYARVQIAGALGLDHSTVGYHCRAPADDTEEVDDLAGFIRELADARREEAEASREAGFLAGTLAEIHELRRRIAELERAVLLRYAGGIDRRPRAAGLATPVEVRG